MIVKINGKPYTAQVGEVLSDVLVRHGYRVSHPCGGKGSCKKCTVTVNGEDRLSCRYRIEGDISVELRDEGEILSESNISRTCIPQGDAILDIGTTTLALAVAEGGEIERVLTRTNPQRAYGSDVISRIAYATEHGTEALQRAVVDEIRSMIDESSKKIRRLYVAANTTMLHLLAGVDPSSMGRAPYTPVFIDEKLIKGTDIGLDCVDELRLLPGISAYVGSDLVAGLCYTGLPDEGYRLLVDLGTNAEVILYSKDKIVCTAAAAGPCFEGANISCGMAATPGAVYAYEGGKAATIGDVPACGICGTGLIDVMAHLVAEEIIDETGYMEDEEYAVCGAVRVTQADVRQYQLAKSAVRSAIDTLIKRMGIGYSDIETMYVAGGFAAKLNISNAVATGLIPAQLQSKCVAIGNSSLAGAARSAAEGTELTALTQIAEYADLAADKLFAQLYMENLMF